VANVIFITGNQGKADFLAKFLGHPVEHVKLDLEEIQSLDFHEVTEHKAKQAYQHIRKPVLVEDSGIIFKALGRLPGTLTKWIHDELGDEGLCRLLDNYANREAMGVVCFAYFDGKKMHFFDGEVHGKIPKKPRGDNWFGWDPIFIPDGSDKTYAEMEAGEMAEFGLRAKKVYPEIKKFLQSI
jgi:non-canonical purine NTP pyrophosphatase (RdgB/HAM1 family)